MLDPRDFLDVANQLYSDKAYDEEAGWRTVIGRAYYASFLASRKRLSELGESFSSTKDVHKEVGEALIDRNSALGNWLDTLRTNRNTADYELRAEIKKNLCGNLLKLAECVLRDLPMIR